MSSSDWLPAQAPFDVVRRGFDTEQVTSHLERLEYDLRIATANRDATSLRLTELTDQLATTQRETDDLRAELDRQAEQPISMAGLSDRMQRMIRIAEEEATEIRTRAASDATALRAELTTALAAQAAERESFDDERERTRRQLAEQVRDLVGEATAEAEATRSQARQESEQLVLTTRQQSEAALASATAEADRTLGDARGEAQRTLTAARTEAQQTVGTARAEADTTLTAARDEAEATLTAARTEAQETLTAARTEAQETMDRAHAEADYLLTTARTQAETLTATTTAERDRLDAEGAARRAQVDEDFEIASQARRAEFHQRLTEREELSVADAQHRVQTATAEAERLVREATEHAHRLVRDATDHSTELVRRATAESAQRVHEADEAVIALTDLRSTLLQQMQELRQHLGMIDGHVGTAPTLLDPPPAEAGRPVTEHFPIDPDERPTGRGADFEEGPLPFSDELAAAASAEQTEDAPVVAEDAPDAQEREGTPAEPEVAEPAPAAPQDTAPSPAEGKRKQGRSLADRALGRH